ncbi:hypothetical protein CAF53_18490 [Sphingobium sp. LB126]|uniref:Uncharacterized protein n=1 Tax=Sphingobium chungbukense TaxID=56193 RepID=A0A0M3AQ83_9SPHN|nr:hypothetical protein YP76_13020 [Sphingobium chungbukense]PJG46195.1 hypothetical protein CAF53_18490 [Sphingobium sp. LB126]
MIPYLPIPLPATAEDAWVAMIAAQSIPAGRPRLRYAGAIDLIMESDRSLRFFVLLRFLDRQMMPSDGNSPYCEADRI